MADTEFVGHGPAAEYIGIDIKTLSGYTARSTGPKIHERRIVDHYVKPVFLKSDIDEWMRSRPGQGARTDLLEAGGARPSPAATVDAA